MKHQFHSEKKETTTQTLLKMIGMIPTNSNFTTGKLRHAVFLFLLSASILTSTFVSAQTQTIQFESGTWEEIKAKAVKENKLIFLDAYATWCGICKKMDRNVFTNDSVAAHFNTHFINAKIDMESGEGLALAKQYHVTAYPNLLFIDGQGKLMHRTIGGLKAPEFIELARDLQNPEKQNPAWIETDEADNRDAAQAASNNLEVGFNISQYQKDFGIGIHVISPYFLWKMVAIKAGTNIQWLENFNNTKTIWTPYQNIHLGIRGRSNVVTHNISIYGEGGMLIILPNTDFSSESVVGGGYGLFGFEFRTLPRFAYFIELGGVGSGATADRIVGKPIYSNGFLINAGLKVGF